MSSELVPPGTNTVLAASLVVSSISYMSERVKATLAPPGSLGEATFPSVANVTTDTPVFPEPEATLPSSAATAMLTFVICLCTTSKSYTVALRNSTAPKMWTVTESSLRLAYTFTIISVLPFRSSYVFGTFSLFIVVLCLSSLVRLVVPLGGRAHGCEGARGDSGDSFFLRGCAMWWRRVWDGFPLGSGRAYVPRM